MAEPFIRTVLGDIPASQLGLCYAHEHIVIDHSHATLKEPLFLLNDLDKIIVEVQTVHDAGGQAMVDTMPIGCGRNAVKLAEVSHRTGIHIIMPTGLHLEQYYPLRHWRYEVSVDQLSQLFIDDITLGVDAHDYTGPFVQRTPHKAGLIKLATGDESITPHQRDIFLAVVQAHLATGAPILTHTNAGKHALAQAELFIALGADPNHIVLSHIDRHPDINYHQAILETGVCVEYDSAFRWALNGQPNQTYRLLEGLLPDFPDQITMGMDAAKSIYWRSYGGAPGLDFLLTTMRRDFEERGLFPYWDRIFYTTPARLYAFKQSEAA